MNIAKIPLIFKKWKSEKNTFKPIYEMQRRRFLILRIGSLWISILTNNINHDLKIYDPILVNYTLKTCLNGVVTQSRANYLYIRE